MAPNYFQKPETALKRAQELIQVGKESDALETLHDTIKARRHKQWTVTHEQIMLKHMELCVNLKKHHVAKDALFQYKTLTQQINVKSLETVVEHFLKMAEKKTEEAQKTSIEKVEEIDDLDQGDIPETILLAFVSGAAAQDRMDRTVLAPWLRFLWDSYRNCLELLRNNSQVEQLYHQITRQTFSFCAKYQRRTEFRKLCELLRLHLNQIQKHQNLPHVVKLSSPESLTLMQETRLCQLDTAIQMELWQEAYKSAEDVHGMMQLSKDKDKRTVKPASYVNYYDKLALIFWKAGNSLFHAAALLQKYTIYKDMKKQFTPEEAQEQASRVLLATLAIPDGADAPSDLTRNLDIEDQHLSNIRLLSNLLRLPIAPTRSGILKEAARIGVPEVASDAAKELYKLLENNFAPLRIAKDVQGLLASIKREDHLQYVDALQAVVAVKTLKQISVIYDSISWERVRKIIPFYSDLELERLVVDSSKHRYVKAHVDHRSGCLRFGAADATLAGGFDVEEADGFTGDDTQLGVEGIRTHLEVMHNKLRNMIETLDGEKRRKELVARVEHHIINYERNRTTEIERILQRRKKLENYKENWERVKAEKTAAAATEAAKREEAMRADEMKRLEEQNKESERKRKQAEQEEVQRKIRQDQLRKMQQNAIYQAIIKEKGLDQFQDMDPETVLREQRERLDKERMETQRRLQQQEKTFDHYVRALHLEEILERKAVMNLRMSEAPKLHEQFEEARVAKEIASHEKAVKTWNSWDLISSQATQWMKEVKVNNADVHQQKIEDWEAKLDAVRNSRMAERVEARRKERKAAYLREKAEEERRRREEEERARQQQFEEQKRQRDKERGDNRRRDMDDSVAMRDSNWRTGGGERAPTRPMRDDRPPRDDRMPMRDRERDREPFSNADRDNSWRTGAAPVAAAAAPSGFGGERREPLRERLPPRAAPAPEERAWTRGNVVKRETPSPAPAPAPVKDEKPAPTKFIPSKLRQQQEGAAASPAAPTRDLGPRSGAPPARDANRDNWRSGPQRQAPPPQRPTQNRAGADNDKNWRRS